MEKDKSKNSIHDLPPVSDLPEIVSIAAQATSIEPIKATVLDIFREVSRRLPHSIAITDGQRSMTYAQLWNYAAAFQSQLREQGVIAGDFVGVAAGRSIPTVAAILGIVMAGACYVPIDLDEIPAPIIEQLAKQGQIRHWIADAAARRMAKTKLWQESCVISLEEVSDAAAFSGRNELVEILPVALDCESPLYVMYTSGSTGLPKGVVVPHRAVVRLVTGQDFLQFGVDQTFLLHSTLSFDASTLELWGSLLHGSRLVVAPSHRLGLDDYEQLLKREGVTTLWLTAALFHLAAGHAPEIFAPLRQLIFGGDVVVPRHVERIRNLYPNLRMVNGYGPTEDTTFTCCYVVPADYRAGATLPIGLPIAHTTIRVLDAEHQPVPDGQEGELAAGGAGVALGYLGQPKATAEKFIPDPSSEESNGLLYLTGDRVRMRQDGVIKFLGRMDRQVKIAGHRVELSAIESALATSPMVTEAAVIVLTPTEGEKELVACVSLSQLNFQAETVLRQWLSSKLSRAHVPQHWLFPEILPINPNGKLDRSALQAMCEAALLSSQHPLHSKQNAMSDISSNITCPLVKNNVTLSTITEYLQQIWADLLGRSTVAVDENFFDIGGTSLLLIEMHARLKAQFVAVPSLVEMFAFPTPRKLAERLHFGREVPSKSQTMEQRGQRQRDAMLAQRPAYAVAIGNDVREDGTR